MLRGERRTYGISQRKDLLGGKLKRQRCHLCTIGWTGRLLCVCQTEYCLLVSSDIDYTWNYAALDTSSFESGNWNIDRIDMMEEDAEVNSSLVRLIESAKESPVKALSLYEYLRSLASHSCIACKRIYFASKDRSETIFIQANGIIGTCHPETEVNSVFCQIIREYIWFTTGFHRKSCEDLFPFLFLT